MPSLNKGDTRLIISISKARGLLRNQCAYVLASVYHETGGRMVPVRETFATSDAQAKSRLTAAWKSGKLPWVKSDYWSGGFFGRGDIQLTHEANYRKAGQKLGYGNEFVSNPDRLLESEISAKVAVAGCQEGWFTGKKLGNTLS